MTSAVNKDREDSRKSQSDYSFHVFTLDSVYKEWNSLHFPTMSISQPNQTCIEATLFTIDHSHPSSWESARDGEASALASKALSSSRWQLAGGTKWDEMVNVSASLSASSSRDNQRVAFFYLSNVFVDMTEYMKSSFHKSHTLKPDLALCRMRGRLWGIFRIEGIKLIGMSSTLNV